MIVRHIVRSATVPGTECTIRIVRNDCPTLPVGKQGAYSVEVMDKYGVSSSYGRATLDEAKATANNHWSYVVANRVAKPMTVGTEVVITHKHGQSYAGTITNKTASAITLSNVTVTRNGVATKLCSYVSIPLNGIAS